MPLSLPALALRSLALLALGALLVLGACGSEIGDACQLPQDCSPDGDRVCLDTSDLFNPDKDGYCTVVGCDHDTCPDEAVCVRFFAGTFAGTSCNPETQDSCSLDEVCTVQDSCALRAGEVRFCMRSCGGDDDCRANYECRGLEQMKLRGGEPVRPAGEPLGTDPARFCAVKTLIQ